MSGKSRKCPKCKKIVHANNASNMDNVYHTHIMQNHPEVWKRMKELLDKHRRGE